MSVITPPAPQVNLTVSDTAPEEDNLVSGQLPVDDDDLLSDLPQGALALMSHLILQQNPLLKLSISDSLKVVPGEPKLKGEAPEASGRAVGQLPVGPRLDSLMQGELARNTVGTLADSQRVLSRSTLPTPVSPGPQTLSGPVTPVYAPAIAAVDNAGAVTELDSLLVSPPSNFEGEKKERQLQSAPVQAVLDKSQAPSKPDQEPVDVHKRLGEQALRMPTELRQGSESYLKIPFSKGEAVGQVIINKPSADVPQQLLLSTNNADVSSLLRDSAQQLQEPRWRVLDAQSDHSGQQDQGAPSQDADEDTHQGFHPESVPQEAEV